MRCTVLPQLGRESSFACSFTFAHVSMGCTMYVVCSILVAIAVAVDHLRMSKSWESLHRIVVGESSLKLRASLRPSVRPLDGK